jgi:transcriptional regulator with XRE-family HTH domain
MVPAEITPEWLRARIAEASITQGEVARICDVTTRAVRKWLSGETGMSRGYAALLDATLRLRAGDASGAMATLRALV